MPLADATDMLNVSDALPDPGPTGHAEAVQRVTVWDAPDWLVQTTVSPDEMLLLLGTKQNVLVQPLVPAATMVTFDVAAAAVAGMPKGTTPNSAAHAAVIKRCRCLLLKTDGAVIPQFPPRYDPTRRQPRSGGRRPGKGSR